MQNDLFQKSVYQLPRFLLSVVSKNLIISCFIKSFIFDFSNALSLAGSVLCSSNRSQYLAEYLLHNIRHEMYRGLFVCKRKSRLTFFRRLLF